jgi:hypothetical protein
MINDDDKFEDLLRDAAQDYNRPPAEVPRDAMWAAIVAAREERAVRPLQIVPRSGHRSLSRYTWLGAAAAAVLLVVTGVGIGRWSALRGPAASSDAVRPVASAGQGQKGAPSPSGEQPSVGQGSSVAAGSSAESPANANAGSASAGAGLAGTAAASTPSGSRSGLSGRNTAGGNRLADRGSVRSTGSGSEIRGTAPSDAYGPEGRSIAAGRRQEVPYQVATIRHLANAEALLTAFRTDSRDAKMDAQLSKWARDLLSNTRLLLDSPAGEDPQRAKLLGDLELVLAQIVQLSPESGAQDRALIEGSIRSGQVMTRLRSAIPAGPTRGL